jgi:ribA/ribD-fused uncharacterized protein
MRPECDIRLIKSTADVLSFHFPSPFKQAGVTFLSAWHYVIYRKALLFRDMVAAHRIKTAPDLESVRGFGTPADPIQNVTESNWLRSAQGILDEANLLKFEQNPELCEALLSTESDVLLSVVKPGTIWCTALPRTGLAGLNRSAWDGLNLEGLSLMATRKKLAARLVPRQGWRWDATPEPVSLQHKLDICFSWTQGYCQLRPREPWLAELKATAPESLLIELKAYMSFLKWDTNTEDPERWNFVTWVSEEFGVNLEAPSPDEAQHVKVES